MNKIQKFKFNEENHQYTLGNKILPSVTQILEAVLFKDKYIGIDKEVLKQAAEKGKIIHQEIDEYCKTGEMGFTEELYSFIELKMKKDLFLLGSEQMITDGNIAGTLDLFFRYKGKYCLGDIKTTAELDKEYVSWQLSIYRYIIRHLSDSCNISLFMDKEIEELYAVWLRKDKIKFIKVEIKTDEQIEEVLSAFLEGRTIDFSTATLQTIPQDKQIAFTSLVEQMKAIEIKTKVIKEAILKEMEDRGLSKVVIGNVTITYKPPTTKTSIDSEKLKEDGIYDKYTKQSEVKSSIVIKVKENE